MAHIRRFLLELGVGFAFVGQQYPIEVGGEEFSIDLLFYHCRLQCYFVIDLKMTDTNDFRVRIGHRRACPGEAMTGQLPTPNALDSQLSVGLVPTEATTAKRLSHSLRWDKPKRGRRPRRSSGVAGLSRLRWGKPNGDLARSHLEFIRVRKMQPFEPDPRSDPLP